MHLCVTESCTPCFKTCTPLKLAVQHLRTSGEHLARGALQIMFMGTMRRTFSLHRSFQLCQALVGSLWHRCHKCAASEEFTRGYCHDFHFEKWLNHMPLSGVAGMLWTRLMQADTSFGQDSGFGDGFLRCRSMKLLARGGWGLTVPSGDMKVMAKLHSPLPGLHQDITLAESGAFLWCVRHVSAPGGTFHTDSLNVQRS